MCAISGSNGSSGFGSVSKLDIDNKTITYVRNFAPFENELPLLIVRAGLH